MDRGPVETRGKIQRRATAILRTRVDEYARLGVVERNDVDPNETSVTIKDVDRESMNTGNSSEKRKSGMRSTGTSVDIFVRGVGVGLTHTENVLIKKLRIARETGDLEWKQARP